MLRILFNVIMIKLKMYFDRSLAWDGYHVLVGGQNGIMYLWDLEKFELINEVQTHSGKYF